MSGHFSRSFLAQSVNSRIVLNMANMARYMTKMNELPSFCLRLEGNLYHKSLYFSCRDEDETRTVLLPFLLKSLLVEPQFSFRQDYRVTQKSTPV